MYKKLLFLSTLLLLPGCIEKKDKTIHEILKVKNGEEFTISLDSNPSTGYSWTMCNYAPSGVIQLKEHKYEAAQETTGKVGVPGKEQFIFKVANITHQTTTYLYFNYVGPGQDGSKPAKQIRYTININ